MGTRFMPKEWALPEIMGLRILTVHLDFDTVYSAFPGLEAWPYAR